MDEGLTPQSAPPAEEEETTPRGAGLLARPPSDDTPFPEGGLESPPHADLPPARMEGRALDSYLLPAAVFLVTFSSLVFEISLTRAFSVLLRYHFVFLAVSLAICGIGLGGLLDYLLRERYRSWRHAQGRLALPLVALALCYPAAVLLLFASPLAGHLDSLWVLTAVCLPPFVCVGVFVSHIFARYSTGSGYLYFADLTGAALGAIGVIALLQLVGGVNAALVCGLIAALAVLVVGIWARRAVVGALAVALLILMGGLLQQNLVRKLVDLPYTHALDSPDVKPLYQDLGDKQHPARLVDSEWNAFARTDMVEYARPDGTFHPEDGRLVYTDGEVPTNMIPFSGNLQAFTDQHHLFLGLYPFRAFQPQQVMLIGPGAGLDVLLALSVGAQEIDGAELNPSIPALVRQYRSYCGPVYDYSNVHVEVAEGRSYLARSDKRYDLIYMALTKTATTASASMALTESYANTTEAFETYYQHLSDNGALAFVCQQRPLLLRAFVTAWAAVQHEAKVNSVEAAKYLAVVDVGEAKAVAGPYRHLLLMTRQPLTPERSAQLAKEALAWGQEPAYFPGALEQFPFSEAGKQAMTPADFVDGVNRAADTGGGWMPLNFGPCPDDKPFVVDLTFGPPPGLWGLAVLSLALVVVLSAGAWPTIRRSGEVTRGSFAAQMAYFSLLGAGFMLIEVALIQKLILYLGYPVLSLSVILFALLLGRSLGSLFSQRWGTAGLPRLLPGAGALAVAWGLVLYAVIPGIMLATLRLNIEARSLLTMALLLPLAFCLGVMFPSGLRLLSGSSPGTVPWMWGVNGLTSVAGSVLAMIVAKAWGFSTVLLLGLACYVLVIALVKTGWAFPKEADAPPG